MRDDGNIFLTGGFQGYFKYTPNDSIESSGLYDVFMLELDESGNALWARNAGRGASYQLPSTLGSDNAENVLLAGLFLDSINVYDEITLYTNSSNMDYFYGAFDPDNGDVKWLNQVHAINSSNNLITDIYCDTNSYVYTGFFEDSVSFENDTIVSYNEFNDVHLFSTDTLGTITWIRRIRGAGVELSYSVLKDDEGYVYVSGYYNSSILYVDSDESSVVEIVGNNGSFDLFVAKYSSSGDLEWLKTAGSTYEDKCFKMEFFDDKVWITGFFADTLNWGGVRLTSSGPSDTDMFTGAIDKDGNFRDANQYSGRNNSDDQGRGLFKSGDNLYTLMRTNSDLIQLGDSIYTSDGSSYYMVLGIIGCLPITVTNENDDNTRTDCYGDSTALIIVSASAGFGSPWQYSIDNGENYSDNGTFNDLPAGDYQLVVIDKEGCAGTGPLVSITQPDTLLPVVVSKEDIFHHTTQDDEIEITEGYLQVSATGGTGPFTYQLIPGGDPVAVGTYYFAYADSGKYVVSVNDYNGCGPSETDTIEIGVIYTDFSGIGDNEGTEIKMYPNPTSGIVNIEVPFEGDECEMEVINVTGQIVLQRKVYSNGGIITETLDLSDQAKGLYMLRVNGQTIQSAIMLQ